MLKLKQNTGRAGQVGPELVGEGQGFIRGTINCDFVDGPPGFEPIAIQNTTRDDSIIPLYHTFPVYLKEKF
jgi:hypothetical protein